IFNLLLLVLNNLFLVFSSFKRLSLYIEGYGFTSSRLLGYCFLPIIAIITLLFFIAYLIEKYHYSFNIPLGIGIFYFALFSALPTDYITNKLNFELAKKDQIAVFDASYTLDFKYIDGMDYWNRNYINSSDGLLVAQEILKYDQNLKDSDFDEEKLEKALGKFNTEYVEYSWREFNLMRYYIYNRELK
ncbi:MAG: DUF4153 domain-containing protein, partial [bacterium]